MEKYLLTLSVVMLLGSLFLINKSVITMPGEGGEDAKAQFAIYKSTFNKKYAGEEDTYRLAVFSQNLQQIAEFNAKKGEAQMGVTLFSDLTDEEFAETYLTKLVPITSEVSPVLYSTFNAPDSLDWRSKGRVTPIKNQGQCGSCWAFSTTGVLEGFFHATTGTLPDLSEQQLVDCAGIIYGNLGCEGGLPSRALKYVKDKGITIQEVYPYKAVKGPCQTQGGTFKIKG